MFILLLPRFSSGFHHTGGDTPEKYNADQSSIHQGDYTDQNNSSTATTYQYQYGNSYEYSYGTEGAYEEVKQGKPSSAIWQVSF